MPATISPSGRIHVVLLVVAVPALLLTLYLTVAGFASLDGAGALSVLLTGGLSVALWVVAFVRRNPVPLFVAVLVAFASTVAFAPRVSTSKAGADQGAVLVLYGPPVVTSALLALIAGILGARARRQELETAGGPAG